MEENIFSNDPSPQSSVNSPEHNSITSLDIIGVNPTTNTSSLQMRPRILSRVENEQNKWMDTVEEQRKNVLQNHTLLN